MSTQDSRFQAWSSPFWQIVPSALRNRVQFLPAVAEVQHSGSISSPAPSIVVAAPPPHTPRRSEPCHPLLSHTQRPSQHSTTRKPQSFQKHHPQQHQTQQHGLCSTHHKRLQPGRICTAGRRRPGPGFLQHTHFSSHRQTGIHRVWIHHGQK